MANISHKSHAATETAEPAAAGRRGNAAVETAEPEPTVLIPDAPLVIRPLLTPTDIASFDDPDAKLGTHFKGPLISGNYPHDGVPGFALLHKRAKIDFTYGNFSIPIKFAASTILTQLIIQVQLVYNGLTPKLNLGTALNGLDIFSQDLSVGPGQDFFNIVTVLASPWTIYLSQVLGVGNSQGKCSALVFYSSPAIVMQN
jgi:hypothetical protein